MRNENGGNDGNERMYMLCGCFLIELNFNTICFCVASHVHVNGQDWVLQW